MSSSDVAISFVISNEKGFEDNAADPGGATNWGISLRFLRGLSAESLRKYGIFVTPESLSVADIKNLTVDQARAIYKGEFWDHANFGAIEYPYICNYIFDCAVLHGIVNGIKIAQRALWAMLRRVNYVADDGVLGESTLDTINKVDPIIFERILMSERAGFVRAVAAEFPREKEFLNGWLNRCYRI